MQINPLTKIIKSRRYIEKPVKYNANPNREIKMFERKNFMVYVGEKSGASYVSGLSKIEEIYKVNVDAEFSKDECSTLLDRIKHDKKRTDLEPKERKKRSDWASHLKRYIAFRTEITRIVPSVQNCSSSLDCDIIHFIIDKYKSDFLTIDSRERYKWKAIGWYKQQWDIDAVDFSMMLASAFEKAGNLLSANMYWPYDMMVEFAEANPEAVRKLFRMLYNENIPLAERYAAFREGFEGYAKPLGKKHYQDLHAISVYLSFEYPEKYFIFKMKIFSIFRKRVGYAVEKTKQQSSVWKVEIYTQMCQLILDEVQKDSELIQMSKNRLDDSCYQDEAYHLLTMDIVFFGGMYMSESDFKNNSQETAALSYWPALDEYNPGITADMWASVLDDDTVTSPKNMDMFRKMLELGGESTCAHLAEVYGNTYGYYNRLVTSFGEKVKKKYNCPDCVDREDDRTERNQVWVIPFVGRYVTENGNKRYSWKLRDELKEALMNMDITEVSLEEKNVTDVGLNTIFYGPPGTGKTYHTVIYSVAIIENKKWIEIEKENYSDVLERYSRYKAEGRIEFTTFHQSYGYEEFIEGIKPILTSEDGIDGETGDIQYSVQPGIFKKFCEKAQHPSTLKTKNFCFRESPNIWKVSLWGTGNNPVRSECLKNGHIRIGWDDYGKDITDETDFDDGGRVVLNAFMNRMQIGDIVFSCYSSTTIDAIGVVMGEYEWHDEYDNLKRLRKVNWIVKDIQENILSINGGTPMTLASVYRLSNVTVNDVYQIIEKYYSVPLSPVTDSHDNNYVFIIDEINRGNISKIFGELITLVEPIKRWGNSEGMKAVLPYSQKSFGVPKNVYIIGTMNTADRSISIIDTALRRRFFFKEMLPNPDVLADVSVKGLSVSNLLTHMNKRIAVLYDREHTIGHAYFMPLKKNPTIKKLAEIFTNNIIPLLQEYFYEDYEKIRLILGNKFIAVNTVNSNDLFGQEDVDLDDGCSYEINYAAFDDIESYRSILNVKENEV
ncbi:MULTISPECIES: AAA family ATPase [unclassified Akkermansia]|uniref:AAA family ATPase n=1 Tax=unclassified Akkermansia TaxID=2608915 RepID=UPI0025B984F3|nr:MULTISPECIES: AAA family ATPase [unclassified Akkermansia]